MLATITIVADRELVLIIELKDENNETNYEAVVLVTYLNCEPTVLRETL
jgi:hypothetical protein